jgi:hypothetical protein
MSLFISFATYICTTKQFNTIIQKIKIMERFALKQDIVDEIKKDPILYGQVASLTGHTILSMRKVLNDNNSVKLTQVTVLKHLSDYLRINQNDLLEVVAEKDDNISTHISQLQEIH